MKVYTLEDVSNESRIFIKKGVAVSPVLRHRHDFVELIYVTDGQGIQGVENAQYRVAKGSMLFVGFGQSHYVLPDGEIRYIEVMFHPEYLCGHILNADNAFDVLAMTNFAEFSALDTISESPVRFAGNEMHTVEVILADMLSEVRSHRNGYEEILNCHLEVLITKMLRQLTAGTESAEKTDILDKICEYIHQNPEKDITLQELAGKCFYNPAYFSRIFKERFGIGFKGYLTRLRVQRSAILLKETDLSLSKIASECGFSEKSAFYRAFEKQFSMTPSQYRKGLK